MSWLRRTIDSSIGGKSIVAITGLMLVGFVIVHLSGNLLVFAGPEALATYTKGLKTYPALLWTARLGLLAALALHVGFASRTAWRNKRARPVPYAKKNYRDATAASRTMLLTGLLVFFYVLVHLAHFTLRISPSFAELGPWDVYQMVVLGFQNPLVSIFYIAAMVVLGFHLSHGVSSLFQSLGLNHRKYNPLLRRLGPIVGFLLAAGYSSIPVAVLLGFIK